MIVWSAIRQKALRPSATLVAASLHALVLMGVALPRPQLAGPAETLEISIEQQQGDASPDAKEMETTDSIAQAQAAPDAKPDPEKPEPVKDEPPPPPPPEPVEEKQQLVAAEAPRREVDDSLEIARRLKRQQEKRLEKLREKREELEEERQEVRRQELHRRKVAAQKAAAQSAHHARSGIANGAHSGASRATFGSRMLSEIRRHQIHAFGQGSVGVAFSVGGSGAVSASVSRSSGDGSLDAAAARIVRSCHPGSPPDGHYSGSVTINFR
jgi:TonB family protein